MSLEVKVDAQKLIIALDKGMEHFCQKEMRGVVAVGANEIRDQAINNAEAIGLGKRGMVRGKDGRMRARYGQIPKAIIARVLKNPSDSVTEAAIFFKKSAKRGPQQTYHALFVEFGTKYMAPQPFFRRALPEARSAAQAEMQKRFNEGVQRILG